MHQDEKLLGQKFIRTDKTADCDIGSFSYSDIKRIKPYIKKSTSKKKVIYQSLPSEAIDHAMFKLSNKISKCNYCFYIFESDLDENIKVKNPVAIFADNRFGDGSFPIFKGRNAFWIMSNDVEEKINGFVNK